MYSPAVWPRSLRRENLIALEVASGRPAHTGPTVSTSPRDRSWDLLERGIPVPPSDHEADPRSPCSSSSRRWPRPPAAARARPSRARRRPCRASSRSTAPRRAWPSDPLGQRARLRRRRARAHDRRPAAQQRPRQAPEPRLEDRVLRAHDQVHEPDRLHRRQLLHQPRRAGLRGGPERRRSSSPTRRARPSSRASRRSGSTRSPPSRTSRRPASATFDGEQLTLYKGAIDVDGVLDQSSA